MHMSGDHHGRTARRATPLVTAADEILGTHTYYLDDRKVRVSVARVGGRLYAFDDLCTHEACPLSAGLLTGTTIMCQCHGSRFDITTGAILNGPATEPLNIYEVKDAEGEIQARI